MHASAFPVCDLHHSKINAVNVRLDYWGAKAEAQRIAANRVEAAGVGAEGVAFKASAPDSSETAA
jgi:hypothetical protein